MAEDQPVQISPPAKKEDSQPDLPICRRFLIQRSAWRNYFHMHRVHIRKALYIWLLYVFIGIIRLCGDYWFDNFGYHWAFTTGACLLCTVHFAYVWLLIPPAPPLLATEKGIPIENEWDYLGWKNLKRNNSEEAFEKTNL